MANYNQAPQIKYNGEKYRDSKGWGKAIRTHELETAIMNGLGERDMAMLKIMLFLTGNAEGFGVAEKTICERCNMSESGYRKARKKLEEKNWITVTDGKIIVNYNVILGITENTPIIHSQKTMGITENTPLTITENTPLGITENTHNSISDSIKDNIKGGKSIVEMTDQERKKMFKF